jgi:hypothetical protein
MTGAPEMSGDPHEGLFVAEVPCYGGGYLTIPSESPEDPFVLENLLEATFLRLHGHDAFKREAAEIALAGLWISDACIRRSGLHRHVEPSHSDNGDIRWPSGQDARSLQAAVRFTREEVLESLAQLGISGNGLRALGFRPGGISTKYRRLGGNPVRRRPLLLIQDDVVLISPGSVLVAIKDAVLKRARRSGCEPTLMGLFRDAVNSRANLSAQLQKWEFLGRHQIRSRATTIEETYFQFDADKVAVIYVLCDDLTSKGTHWRLQRTVTRVKSRMAEVEKQLFASRNQLGGILHLICVQGIGRAYGLGVAPSEDYRCIRMSITGDEFRVFALLNLNDELALWQVGRARDHLPKVTAMLGGFLDQYAWYRNRSESFYFSDEGRPDAVFFQATGIQPRLELQRRLDPHVVRRPDSGAYEYVAHLQGRPDFLVYGALAAEPQNLQFLVEGLAFPVWVVATASDDVPLIPNFQLYFHVTDIVAFWLWQTTASLNSLIDASSKRPKELLLRVGIDRVTEWYSASNTQNDSFGIRVTPDGSTALDIQFGPEFAAQSAIPNNSAERELVRLLVRNIGHLLDVPLDRNTEDQITDQNAPPGVKRRCMVIHGDLQDTLGADDLPRARKVQKFDEGVIEDDLGSHLARPEQHGTGEIPDEARHTICNRSVAFLYKEFELFVASMSSDRLLEQLIARHESLIADRKTLDVITATHLACFGHTSATLTELKDDISATDKASMASRFVIEYVAARPPNGGRIFSLAAYDRLLALASKMIYFGRLSDSLKYKLSAHSFEILKSGRLALSDPRYEQAMSEFEAAYFQRIAATSVADHQRIVERSIGTSRSSPPDDFAMLEEAVKAEFGLSITQIGRLLGVVASSPFNHDGGTGSCCRNELVGYLRASTSLDESTIRQALELFTLGERADFDRPSRPYRRVDVYPWRFNRPLSYLRRPLILRTGELLWGCRALRQAHQYLVRLCTSGRLKDVRSDEMKRYQGAVTNRLGRDFNDKVAERLKENGQYIVRKQVKKFNRKRIRRTNGNDLGDIDVIAVDRVSRIVVAIESKCFAIAKTPAELAVERDELFGDLASDSGAVGRHIERTEWMRHHLIDVLKELRLNPDEAERWRVEPLLVIDEDLISPRLVGPPFPVVTLDALLDHLIAFQT